ncbi:MAG: tRNA pseudouridine(38-40) synthase TruA [Candidatus Zixiibacteriota bacterium]|nr:MAG: tRNA pseudouridine(38-40) synthase TruA [candidate division Zixibacteria bacterium]
MKKNFLMKLEYRGTDFEGWQIQAKGRTVQGILSDCLSKFAKERINLIGAGRTDSGVHALGQYANFTTEKPLMPSDVKYKLNRMIPDNIVVLSCREVPLRFDSRKGAISRSYRYLISEKLSALNVNFSWIIGRRLDISILNDMAARIRESVHFDNFCKVKSRKYSNDCVILDAGWSRYGGFLRFDISANRFLHNMVRLLVGSMAAVEKGKLKIEKFYELLENKTDEKTKYIAPACGLYLLDVKYEGINA